MVKGADEQLRIDKLLWYLRLARSRTIAQLMVETGHIRLEGRRISRSSTMVQVGQHLVIPIGDDVEVIRIISLPNRRGPAEEARNCYERIIAPDNVANASMSATFTD